MEIRDIINKAYEHYACLQKEDYFFEYEENKYIAIKWHVYMDRFVSMTRVKQIAKFLRKNGITLPIYDSFMNIY